MDEDKRIKIKTLENYFALKHMFLSGETGNAKYFAQKLNIGSRSFFNYLRYLREEERMEIVYEKYSKCYRLEYEDPEKK